MEEPPLPSDLLPFWNPFTACLQHVIEIRVHPLFYSAFERHQTCVQEVGEWIEDQRYWEPCYASQIVARYNCYALQSLVKGWYIRRIIDGFVNRWSAVAKANIVDETAVAEATSNTEMKMGKMVTVIGEIETLYKKWMAYLD